MPAITSLSIYVAAELARRLKVLGKRLGVRLREIPRLFKHRRSIGMLARLDDRMLADIGLTRSDLRDANAEPLWHDPTNVLARRACERRVSRRRVACERSAESSARGPHYPSANRPAQHVA
jgi:uncharacterized protein YjiS (DUF1127 family)